MNAPLRNNIGVLTALWNAHIPKRALRFEFLDGRVRYLHPTKGWRVVSHKRLGIV